MKPILTPILITIILFSASFSLAQTSMDSWESLLNKKQLAEYFSGIFNRMGFVIEETQEEFTVIHQGDHFMTEKGISREKVDYVVKLKLENIENMQKHGSDNTIDESESFRIMSVLFTPLTEASLANPMLNKPLMRKMSGIESHIHVNLINPDKTDTVSHTLIYLNKSWIVVPDRQGKARRTFNLTAKDAIDYQKQVFIALQKDTVKGWKEFKKWYMNWRKGVSWVAE